MNAEYLQWRSQFIRNRLQIVTAIAALCIFSFMLWIILTVPKQALTVNGQLSFQHQDHTINLITDITLEVILIGLFFLLRSRYANSFIYAIFIFIPVLISSAMQLDAVSSGVVAPFFISWVLVFVAYATFVPVCWHLHLAFQAIVFINYLTLNYIFGYSLSDIWALDQQFITDKMILPISIIFLFVSWICVMGNLSVFLYECLQRREFVARKELEEQKERSERLLLNVLPQSIAERLKLESDLIADSFQEVTVLFADIVGFTLIAEKNSPEEVVGFLNQIFSRFDVLAESYGLEKIKTIGDAYMAVAGLPFVRDDHAQSTVEMAIAMQKELEIFNQEYRQNFKIRIGISSGPVVAGVIGIRKFAYDLWGDTVNTASRMESHGIAGCIQISESTYEHLRDRYQFEVRDRVTIKGKGEMTTYILQNSYVAI